MIDNAALRSFMAFKNIPEDLQRVSNWVCWKAAEKNPPHPWKFDKIPYSAVPSGKKAKPNDPATWSTFDQALRRWSDDTTMTGLGFVFSDNDPYAGIDLDRCRDPETGVIEPWAIEIIDAFDSYCEISPSGTGVKIFCRGAIPLGGNKRDNIEMYHQGRFFTVTGRVLDDFLL